MSPASNATNGVNNLLMRLAVREGTANNSAGYVSTNAFSSAVQRLVESRYVSVRCRGYDGRQRRQPGCMRRRRSPR